MTCFQYIKGLIRPIGEGKIRYEFKDLKLKYAKPGEFSVEDLTFTFIRKSTGEEIKIWVKDGVVPEKLPEIINPEIIRKIRAAKATEEEWAEFKAEFGAVQDKFLRNVLKFPQDKLFEFEKG